MRNRFRTLLLVLWMLGGATWPDQQGVLYYAEGGTGGGKVHLLCKGRLQKLIWRKGQWQDGVKEAIAWKHGALWIYEQEEGYLTRARFTGAYQKEVQAGVNLVHRHFDQLSQGQWTKAYSNLSPAWKKQQTLEEFQKGQMALKYSQTPAPTYAIKVIGHNRREVLVLVNAHWFIPADPSFYRYTLVLGKSGWVLDQVDPISAAQFSES